MYLGSVTTLLGTSRGLVTELQDVEYPLRVGVGPASKIPLLTELENLFPFVSTKISRLRRFAFALPHRPAGGGGAAAPTQNEKSMVDITFNVGYQDETHWLG
jgi:hypothetical protein